MTFTDEDLKRLKERLNDPVDDEIDKSLESLIARLEAAEAYAFRKSAIEKHLEAAWRKACGRE